MKILFVTNNLRRDPSNIALFERVWKMKPGEHDVTILAMIPLGALKEKLPEYAKLIHPRSKVVKEEKFDTVAVFGDMTSMRFAIKSVEADDRELFLFNYDSKKDRNHNKNISIYNKFNHVYTCDYSVKSSFLKSYPDLAGVTFIIPDTIAKKRISRLASKQGGYDGFEGVRLLSVLTHRSPGEFWNIIKIAKVLKKRGFYFRWYIIGSGGAIPEDLEESVFNKNVGNYYPYLDQCDIYVDLKSRGIHTTILPELVILEKPVVAVDCISNRGHFSYDSYSLFVENNPEVFADGIEYMMMELD